jgi:hypothetical protein
MNRSYYPAWDMDTSDEIRWQKRLGYLLRALSFGQKRVARSLISDASTTYLGVAQELGIHVGSVHRHLHRIRNQHPKIYRGLMTERRRLLATRHEQALKRAAAHNEKWFQFLCNRGD